MPSRSKYQGALVAIALVAPSAAMADMPMFFVLAFTRFVYWWTIPLAIAVELVAIRYIFHVTWNKAVVLSLAVNALSAAAGILVYPLVGAALYPALAPTVIGVFGYGLVVEVTATTLAMAVVDTLMELGLIALLLRIANLREGVLFFAANVMTAAILLAAILHANAPPRLSEADRADFLSTYSEELALLSEVLEEAPFNLGSTDFRFDERWLADKAVQAEGSSFTVLRVMGDTRMSHVVSAYGRGMYGATLEGQATWREFTIRRWTRDPRDGGATYWTVVGSLDRDGTRYSVNAEIE